MTLVVVSGLLFVGLLTGQLFGLLAIRRTTRQGQERLRRTVTEADWALHQIRSQTYQAMVAAVRAEYRP